jgi:SPP1 family phage portal protein
MSITLYQVELQEGERLDAEQIQEYIGLFETNDRPILNKLYKYFVGKNPKIQERKTTNKFGQVGVVSDSPYDEIGVPNNIIPVPYGRTIIETVIGYMFKPGLITYSIPDEQYNEELHALNKANNEPLESSQIATQSSLYGVGYELLYTDVIEGKAVPRFTKIDSRTVIPIYDFSVEENLICAIRFYNVKDVDNAEKTIVEVYYEDIIQIWETDKIDAQTVVFRSGVNTQNLTLKEEFEHFYGQVPINVYRNNEEFIGDFEPITPLIDSYDALISDSMNEFERFAEAYLRLVGESIDTEDLNKIKQSRIFQQLESKDAVSFLTKDVNTEFITFMSNRIIEEIHKQSGIPDLTDEKFAGNVSGVAIKYKLFAFETLASTKEAYFLMGLKNRYKMIGHFLNIRDQNGDKIMDINFKRNLPANLIEIADIMMKLNGEVSRRTRLKLLPGDLIDNIDAELEALKEERENLIDIDQLQREMIEEDELREEDQ